MIDENNLKTAVEEEQGTGNISFNVWKSYFLSGENVLLLTLLLIVIITSQVIISGNDYFVNYWTQQEALRSNNQPTRFTENESLYIYGALICLVILVNCSYFFYLFFF